MKYFGEYNQNGYSIFSDDREADAVYQAGNCQSDSAQYLPIGALGTIDLFTIAEFCEYTGKAIAAENNDEWLGCSRIDDDEPADYDLEENKNVN